MFTKNSVVTSRCKGAQKGPYFTKKARTFQKRPVLFQTHVSEHIEFGLLLGEESITKKGVEGATPIHVPRG